MPFRHAHRAALRRSNEPHAIIPASLVRLPLLPAALGWRNPVRGDDYDRFEWQIYIVLPHASVTLARVIALADVSFEFRAGDAYARLDCAAPGFELAAAWATARLAERSSYLGAAE
ncbi:hypothetical protein OR60_07465 [Xanthomonas vesicatoria]|uniref:Uncharacterized protein n=1 Tax=Xanthomonas vesicatoria TaxID=56460 RepID=A0AAJ0N5L2_9XANT|nr:hypothetical protein BI313_02970 [Xanthomonas vesicatoria]KHM95758.1 hypothetical protein OR60_07465 [Xanthomonas vesicatoria]KHM97200.1 hypothetical protein OR61_04370 [Xanthomonas vesicatoria]